MNLIFSIFCISLAILAPLNSYASERYQWTCIQDDCKLYILLKNGKKILATEGWDEGYTQRSAYKEYDNNMSSVILGCGNNCTYSIFTDLSNGKVTEPLYDVLAVNCNKQLIVLPDHEDKEDNTLKIVNLFDSNGRAIKIKREFYRGADASAHVKFLDDNHIELNYDIDEEGNTKKEIIKIDYHKLMG